MIVYLPLLLSVNKGCSSQLVGQSGRRELEIPILRQDWKFPFPLRDIWQERVFQMLGLPPVLTWGWESGPAQHRPGLTSGVGAAKGKAPGKNCRWVRIYNAPGVPSIPSLCYHPDEQWKVSLGE